MATPKKPFKPSSGHQITVGEAHQLLSTISAYGKVITGVTMDPSKAGTVHPQGKDEDLQLALVFGTSSQGKCVTLSPPQKVYMPAPDGPADGCGWDPAQYVVWKNLPLDWTTVHVQTQAKPLAMALAPNAVPPMAKSFLAAAAVQKSLNSLLCTDWMGLDQPRFISSDWTLAFIFCKGTGNACTVGDQKPSFLQALVAAINSAYSAQIGSSDLSWTMSASSLAQKLSVPMYLDGDDSLPQLGS
jgi:hypothetical protein